MKLLIEVEAKRVEDRFQEILKDFQRGVTLPGFREGKAPFDLIEKKFTKEAEEEVLKSLIPEAYHQSVVTHKLSPVTLPSIADIKLERRKSLTFSAEFERTPEFSLKNYKGIKIQKIPSEVSRELAAHQRTESYEKMRENLFMKLLSLASFSIPDGLVEKQKERLIEQARRQYEKSGLSSEQFEQQKDNREREVAEKARNQVKLYFILQRIADQEDVEIDEIELEQKLTALSVQSKQSIEEVRRVFEEDLRESMREAKTVEFLLANAKLEEK